MEICNSGLNDNVTIHKFVVNLSFSPLLNISITATKPFSTKQLTPIYKITIRIVELSLKSRFTRSYISKNVLVIHNYHHFQETKNCSLFQTILHIQWLKKEKEQHLEIIKKWFFLPVFPRALKLQFASSGKLW